MKLQFSTCAMCRPEILEETYRSWTNKMKGISYKDSTLFIDVAPIPPEDIMKREMVVEVAKAYFGNVITNLPSERNFFRAMKWCWSEASADYLFHLEDDWRLEKEFHIDELFSIMKNNPKIMQVSVRHHPSDWRGVTFCPGLLKKIYYKTFAEKFLDKKDEKVYMSYEANPEAFMRRIQWDVGISYENAVLYPNEIIVSDIGEKWKRQRAFFSRTYLSQYKSE